MSQAIGVQRRVVVTRRRARLVALTVGLLAVAGACATDENGAELSVVTSVVPTSSGPATAVTAVASEVPVATVAVPSTLAPPTPSLPPTTEAPATTATPTTVAPTTTVVAPFAVEEINATLAPAVQAWAAAPSGPTYDAMSAAARSVVESGRPLADVPGAAAGGTSELVAGLMTYPGSDAQVMTLLTQLGPAAPTVTLPAPTTTAPAAPTRFVDTATDPNFGTCREAIANGYGPYRRGETEYSWYRDADSDGIVCE